MEKQLFIGRGRMQSWIVGFGFCLVILFVSCNPKKSLDMKQVHDEEFWINFIDTSIPNSILCSETFFDICDTISESIDTICLLDSCEKRAIKKMINLDADALCILIDSCKQIEKIAYIDSSCNVSYISTQKIFHINSFIDFLSCNLTDNNSFRLKFDSIETLPYNDFYIKYILFRLLPANDSIQKMNIVSQLRADTANFKKKLYVREALEVFKYNRMHSHVQENIQWDSRTIDLREIEMGKEVIADFVFCNKGSEPLIILGVGKSCGCLDVVYPKLPIRPGESGKIVLKYTPESPGFVYKTITLRLYGGQPVKLAIKANVISNGC